jgi:hypothetical protein
LGESGSAVTPEARAIIEKAYEYVLSNVGIDKDAGPIWADYIYFLKSAEVLYTLILIKKKVTKRQGVSIRPRILGKNNARWILCVVHTKRL